MRPCQCSEWSLNRWSCSNLHAIPYSERHPSNVHVIGVSNVSKNLLGFIPFPSILTERTHTSRRARQPPHTNGVCPCVRRADAFHFGIELCATDGSTCAPTTVHTNTYVTTHECSVHSAALVYHTHSCLFFLFSKRSTVFLGLSGLKRRRLSVIDANLYHIDPKKNTHTFSAIRAYVFVRLHLQHNKTVYTKSDIICLDLLVCPHDIAYLRDAPKAENIVHEYGQLHLRWN